jgi:hypothetical protein
MSVCARFNFICLMTQSLVEPFNFFLRSRLPNSQIYNCKLTEVHPDDDRFNNEIRLSGVFEEHS